MKKHGFTLIELLVAMTIIAVLAGLGLVSYQGARKSARDGRRKTELEEIRSALEMYRSDNNNYPGTLGPLSGYTEVPSDPLSDRQYAYSYNSGADTYTLCAALEAGGGSVTGCGSCTITCNYKTTNP